MMVIFNPHKILESKGEIFMKVLKMIHRMGKIFANHIFEKELASKICKELG